MARRFAPATTVRSALACLAALSDASSAQEANGPVKLAVLDDMSGPYAENAGQGNVLAVRMASVARRSKNEEMVPY